MRVALIGVGRWGKYILRDLKALGCEVVAVDLSEAGRERAREGGANLIVENIATLPAIEGAVIATPTDQHADSIEALLPLGIPIFVEKAMTNDATRARAIVDKAGERVFVMDKWRYHPGVEKLRELAASGELGNIIGLRAIRWGWSTNHFELDPVWLLIPHDLSIALHVLGEIPAPHRAIADPLGPRGSGVIAWLGGEGAPEVVIDVSSIQPMQRRSVTLVGTKATAQLGGSYDNALAIRRGPPAVLSANEETIALADDMPLLAELTRFIGFIRGGPAPMSSASEGARIVETVIEIRRLAGI
jgi:predicted dehydrogenase